jgi:hypothetical protein
MIPAEARDWYLPPALVEQLEGLCHDVLLAGGDYAALVGALQRHRDGLLEADLLLCRRRGTRPGADPELRFRWLVSVARWIWLQLRRPPDWRPTSAPTPTAQERCWCGSGRAFQACCATLPDPASRCEPIGLSLLLRRVPTRHWRGLLDLHLPAGPLAAELKPLAEPALLPDGQWSPGRAGELTELLLDWLQQQPTLLAEQLPLISLALELEGRQQGPAHSALLDRLRTSEDASLKLAGWLHAAGRAADAGNPTQAWDCFRQAQRLAPNHPDVVGAEIVLLLAEDRLEEAQNRAQLGLKLLERRGDAGSAMADFLADVRRHGRPALLHWCAPERYDCLVQLETQLAELPPPASTGRWTDGPEWQAASVADATAWITLLGAQRESPTALRVRLDPRRAPNGLSRGEDDHWFLLACLPELLDDLVVLDVLLGLLLNHLDVPGVLEGPLRLLLDRAQRIVEAALSDRSPQPLPLDRPGNLPLLRILAIAALLDPDGDGRALARAQPWMPPDDPFGLARLRPAGA